MEKILAFDVEISKIIPPDCTDWKTEWPLGISCAATLPVSELGQQYSPTLWHGEPDRDGLYPHQMMPEECRALARYLEGMVGMGWLVTTFNGLGFDHAMLLSECQDDSLAPMIKRMARQHCDIAFAMFAALGFMVALDTCCRGMGLEGKPEGMDGAMAPKLWAQGPEEQKMVLDYVARDVRILAGLHREVTEKGYIRWQTRRGTTRTWIIKGDHIPTVEEAMQLPEPDVSWMQDPWRREKFTGWLGEQSD